MTLHADTRTTALLWNVFPLIPNIHTTYPPQSCITSPRLPQRRKWKTIEIHCLPVLGMSAGPRPQQLQGKKKIPSLPPSFYQPTLIPNLEVKSFTSFLSPYDPHHVCIIECSNLFLKKKLFKILFLCVWLFFPVRSIHRGPKENTRCFGTRVSDGWESPCECWELTLSPLKGEPRLLPTRSSVQLPFSSDKDISHMGWGPILVQHDILI